MIKELVDAENALIECDRLLAINNNIMIAYNEQLTNLNKEVYHSKELLNAIDLGYRVKRIYNRMLLRTTTEIFKGYVNAFLEVKVNNSGLPFKFCSKIKEEWTDDDVK